MSPPSLWAFLGGPLSQTRVKEEVSGGGEFGLRGSRHGLQWRLAQGQGTGGTGGARKRNRSGTPLSQRRTVELYTVEAMQPLSLHRRRPELAPMIVPGSGQPDTAVLLSQLSLQDYMLRSPVMLPDPLARPRPRAPLHKGPRHSKTSNLVPPGHHISH